MSKHLPGPWTWKPSSDGKSIEIVSMLSCALDPGVWVDAAGEASEANARLVAAVPELLEALLNMIGMFDTPLARIRLSGLMYDEARESARAALQKARGE